MNPFSIQPKNKIVYWQFFFQILDFSENKLQEIHADTFSGYTSIKYLYLAENQLYSIDEDGLTSLTYLEILDLSNNVILELPKSLFQLPSLRKLNLRGNPLLHKSFKDLDLSKPIRAPLELIDISDCKIKDLPDWGPLPQMKVYNISHNPLAALDVRHFADMCNLEKVDLSKSLNEMELCDMRPAVIWFQMTRIYFQDTDYSRLNTQGSYIFVLILIHRYIKRVKEGRCNCKVIQEGGKIKRLFLIFLIQS